MRLKKIFDSIAFRISVSIAVVIAAAIIAVGWFILMEEQRILEADLRSKGRYLAEFIAHSLINPLLNENPDALNSHLTGPMKSGESLVVYTEVYDRNKEFLQKAYKDETYQDIAPPPLDFKALSENIDIRADSLLPVIYFSLPVYDDSHGTIGFLRISMTKEFLNTTLAALKSKLLLLASAVIFGGIVLGLLMARRILRPILILNRGVQRVGEGDVGVEIPVVGEGEIKELAISFNYMSRQLKRLIDDIRTAQENLVRTEKLYAIGEFSAGVAHEIRNPLTSIKMLIQAHENKKQVISGKNFAVIQGEIDRIDRMITEFLSFTRPGAHKKTDVKVSDILEEVIIVTRPMMEQSAIQLKENLLPALPVIRGHNDALKQVFMNLVLNAIQAMEEEGGTLNIETSAHNGNISIIIRDTGTGIPEKEMKKIFEPFYTTKESGTGMGLALTYATINDHAGNIQIKSTPTIGTTITVELPL